MNITEKIHKLRIEKGWSVAKLARETDIPTVSLRVMLSRNNPNSYNIKALSRIAECLGVTVSYLTLEDSDEVKPQLSEKQKEELSTIIRKSIDEYFDTKK